MENCEFQLIMEPSLSRYGQQCVEAFLNDRHLGGVCLNGVKFVVIERDEL